LNLGGERHLDEMYDLSKKFHEAWDLEEGETMAMVLRVIHAPPPSVHSIRRPLGKVLSRNTETLSTHGASANGASSSNGASIAYKM
jgi:hypothetical protein